MDNFRLVRRLARRWRRTRNRERSRHLGGSWTLDAELLIARLREIPPDLDVTRPLTPPLVPSPPVRSEHSSPSSYETPLYDRVESAMKFETAAYHKLLALGGRPAYPLSMLEDVVTNPEEHREILLPFQSYEDTGTVECEVFEFQCGKWKGFRVWQECNRGPDYLEKKFAAYLEKEWRTEVESPTGGRHEEMPERLRKSYRARFEGEQKNKGVDKGEAGWLAFLEERKQEAIKAGYWWPGLTDDQCRQVIRAKFNRKYHDWYEWPNCRRALWWWESRDADSFPLYVAEAERRLAHYSFARTFQLDMDPARQDKLTTWIEYLNYEYFWLDLYERALAHSTKKCEEEWKEWDAEHNGYRRACKCPAPCCDHIVERRISRRQRFFEQNEDYKHAKRDVECQRRLTQWVLEQLPLVEAEMNGIELVDRSSARPAKRKRPVSSPGSPTHHPERPPKRPRDDGQDSPPIQRSQAPETSPPQPQVTSGEPTAGNRADAEAEPLSSQAFIGGLGETTIESNDGSSKGKESSAEAKGKVESDNNGLEREGKEGGKGIGNNDDEGFEREED
ncbi:hypothetical protein F5Y17DRAFT_186420 [Xylariaceae sp. FL0594]|nr:hypothetical protein F5Y17DRAFT_186420 [Xylariaceae sp. FL0594]